MSFKHRIFRRFSGSTTPRRLHLVVGCCLFFFCRSDPQELATLSLTPPPSDKTHSRLHSRFILSACLKGATYGSLLWEAFKCAAICQSRLMSRAKKKGIASGWGWGAEGRRGAIRQDFTQVLARLCVTGSWHTFLTLNRAKIVPCTPF